MQLCADGIVDSISKFQDSQKSQAKDEYNSKPFVELLADNLDSAQTIVLCAQHQKRIIDDVLTLSKLNATMLQVTPVEDQIEYTIRGTIKMFQGELDANNIRMSFFVDESYGKEQIDWVLCDPARVKQVFINLLSNVRNFTISASSDFNITTGHQVHPF